MHVERNAAAANGPRRMARSRKPDSGPTDNLSLTIRRRWDSWNLMKPRIQSVLTQWNPGSSAFGGGPDPGGSRVGARCPPGRDGVPTARLAQAAPKGVTGG
jgi:hypothetical protein